MAKLTGLEKYTIYAMRDPKWRKNKRGFFYIGVTKGTAHDRWLDHKSEAKNGHPHLKFQHIRKMWQEGREVEIVTLVADIEDRVEAFKIETQYIHEVGYDSLLNMSSDRKADGLYAQQREKKSGTRDDLHRYDGKKDQPKRPAGYKEGDFIPRKRSSNASEVRNRSDSKDKASVESQPSSSENCTS